MAAYVATYLERDVRQIISIQDLAAFQRFVRLCAGRTGQLLNLSALGGEAGITPGHRARLARRSGGQGSGPPPAALPTRLRQTPGQGPKARRNKSIARKGCHGYANGTAG